MSGAGSRAQSASASAGAAKGAKGKKSGAKDAAPSKPPADELDAMTTEQLAEVWRLEQARLQEARRNRNYYQLEAVSQGDADSTHATRGKGAARAGEGGADQPAPRDQRVQRREDTEGADR